MIKRGGVVEPLIAEAPAALQQYIAELEQLVHQADHCWHCHALLLPEARPHCDTCPEFDSCYRLNCGEPGCTERAEEAQARLVRAVQG